MTSSSDAVAEADEPKRERQQTGGENEVEDVQHDSRLPMVAFRLRRAREAVDGSRLFATVGDDLKQSSGQPRQQRKHCATRAT
jgi:hypothetical protein